MRKYLLLFAALAALTLAACGDDDTDTTSEAEESSVSAEQAIDEIAAVRAGLADALDQYESGDAATAEDTVSETYLQHFELVEVPLEEADPELNEELEILIRETTTQAIASGEPIGEVSDLIDDANAELDEAEAALEGSSSQEQSGSSTY